MIIRDAKLKIEVFLFSLMKVYFLAEIPDTQRYFPTAEDTTQIAKDLFSCWSREATSSIRM